MNTLDHIVCYGLGAILALGVLAVVLFLFRVGRPVKRVEERVLAGMTWTCHSCRDERPDDLISVLTWQLPDLPGAQRNWRYCNDRPECLAIAQKKAESKSV